jgi:hypothetical protein
VGIGARGPEARHGVSFWARRRSGGGGASKFLSRRRVARETLQSWDKCRALKEANEDDGALARRGQNRERSGDGPWLTGGADTRW